MHQCTGKGSWLFQTSSQSNHNQVKRLTYLYGRASKAFVPTEGKCQGSSCGVTVGGQGSRMFTADEVPPNILSYYRGLNRRTLSIAAATFATTSLVVFCCGICRSYLPFINLDRVSSIITFAVKLHINDTPITGMHTHLAAQALQ
jgi:hypothetical protein